MQTEDDVFQDQSSNVVDCDLLEAAKENVQPLATGRRVTSLSTILATPHAQRETKLAETRKRLRINVELALEDEDGDPLEAYCRLVYWTVENYPQGHSAESGLLELLEESTRALKDFRNGVWRGDLRYLKLWLLYASYVEKPTMIYKFLIANDIGTSFALLYEEHAAVLERDGRRKEADEVYSLGIARRASPLDHLENRYHDFQKRMMSTVSRHNPTPEAISTSQAPRPALAQTLAPAAPVLAASLQPVSNSRLQIFVDPSGAESQLAEAAANEWNALESRKIRVKENVPEVKKFGGSTLKQAGRSKRIASSSSASSSSKIIPYRDTADMPPPPVHSSSSSKDKSSSAKTPDKGFAPFIDTPKESAAMVPSTPKFTPFRDEAESTPPAITPIGDSVIRVKKAGLKVPTPTSEAEALRKDPLKNYLVNEGTQEDGS
ncbi:uncharacterized protein LACBIDRAFT_297584 [Laccaria bicolor S238N-H82]|uniref:Predicted protein n=1 Tax=Laccaria bicolor (strain S238N-H82 / ATCC MYA-4686) TaxID=486041 RepID=B0DBJ0_LACBS|nr:uncharacterized protein LACBIDRAFT_297584 [Laccaria bicolor S238N-H82]EDR08005.1 predicted protein [Laccaria bicolor S238N-H82]|eukprot:XP_001881075.1 predicted protein [Laccaria bicolor S238N-H82]